jgi:hypothetical protein
MRPQRRPLLHLSRSLNLSPSLFLPLRALVRENDHPSVRADVSDDVQQFNVFSPAGLLTGDDQVEWIFLDK